MFTMVGKEKHRNCLSKENLVTPFSIIPFSKESGKTDKRKDNYLSLESMELVVELNSGALSSSALLRIPVKLS